MVIEIKGLKGVFVIENRVLPPAGIRRAEKLLKEGKSVEVVWMRHAPSTRVYGPNPPVRKYLQTEEELRNFIIQIRKIF